LEVLDEIEHQIGRRATPVTWPVGPSGAFRGVIDRRTGEFTRFTRTARGTSIAPEELVPAAPAPADEGSAWTAASDEVGLLDAVGAVLDEKDFLSGASTPVFVGSALTNFGVRNVLDAVVDLPPPPSPRPDVEGEPRRLDADCSAFVFK